MKARVLLNAAAGLRPGQVQAEAARVCDLFARFGVDAEVRLVPGPELLAAAREAAVSDADVVVMAVHAPVHVYVYTTRYSVHVYVYTTLAIVHPCVNASRPTERE